MTVRRARALVCVCAVQLPSNLVWAMLSAGWEHSCGVTSASEGHCWGKSSYGQTTVPSGHSWSSISAAVHVGGLGHACEHQVATPERR